ncbi:MAG: peptidoglycan-binding protein [Candidatus Peribacteria bacterium]|nr:peptidoglycan-binding protein [Candidatus Peribacteria bacterium]
MSSKTKNAVKKFQQDNGLKVDGLPGKNTIIKIMEKL